MDAASPGWFRRHQHLRRSAPVAGLLLAISLVVGTAPPASALVATSDGGDVPFYARITDTSDPDQVFSDAGWTAIVFYRPLACVPLDFNLLMFFHFPGPSGPGAFGCGPPTTDGVNYWENGPGLDPAPTLAITHGLGAVPVLFVDADWIAAEVASGSLTMNDVNALQAAEPGKVILGTAAYFQQVLKPHGTNAVPLTSFVARGTLDGGGPFSVAGVFVEGVTTSTRIVGLPPVR